uniref:Costars domain-containing protein n=1 Tax=Rhabditophanes sp. KR3021 TaxID=114890 RepID=A0AC35U8K3_9BILA
MSSSSARRYSSTQDFIAKFNSNDQKTNDDKHDSLIIKRRDSNTLDAISKFNAGIGKSDPVHPPHPQPRKSSIKASIDKFNDTVKKTDEELKRNPYSKTYEAPVFDKNSKDYGRPEVGSKTAKRADKAGDYITREIIFLCETINGYSTGEFPNQIIKFGPLFQIYNYYSSSLCGMLIRCRKYGLLTFEGEMLYQRQDDHKIIRMLKTMDEIRNCVKYSGDPVNCVAIVENN